MSPGTRVRKVRASRAPSRRLGLVPPLHRDLQRVKVWVLAPHGHRIQIYGVFSTEEKAHEHLRELDGEEDDDEWEFPYDDYHLEAFEIDE